MILPDLSSHTIAELDLLLDHVVRARLRLHERNWTTEGWHGNMTQRYKCKHCKAQVDAATITEAATQHVCPVAGRLPSAWPPGHPLPTA